MPIPVTINKMIGDLDITNIVAAPVTWSADCYSDGNAIYIDDNNRVIGTKDQRVIFFSPHGIARRQFKLNNPVTAIFQDGGLLYAWCQQRLPLSGVKGSLYDISHDHPRHILDVGDFADKIVNAAMKDGVLFLGNSKGHVRAQGCTGHVIWERTEDLGDGGMFEVDDNGLYVAHKKKVVRYNLDTGVTQWEYAITGSRRTDIIHAGAQNEDSVFFEAGGKVTQVGKNSGWLVKEFVAFGRHRAENVVVGNGLLFTGEFPTVIFDIASGKEVYRLMASIKFKNSVAAISPDNQLLVFWDMLYNIDLSERSLSRAKLGRGQNTMEFSVPDEPNDVLEESLSSVDAEESSQPGILVECSLADDERVVASRKTGGRKDWHVALPLGYMANGETYLVEELLPCDKAQYWRCKGSIQRYVKSRSNSQADSVQTDQSEASSISGDQSEASSISGDQPESISTLNDQ